MDYQPVSVLTGARFYRRCLLLAVLAISTTSVSVQAAGSASLGGLINQRLGWMKDVAGSKATHHQPVEDLPQESKVMTSTLDIARHQGIAPDSIRPFIQAQMDVAKAIQYRYRADWLSAPEPNWQPRPLPQIRDQISLLSGQIVNQIAADLKAGKGHFPPAQSTFIAGLNQPNLSPADKEQLYQTLSQIRLEK